MCLFYIYLIIIITSFSYRSDCYQISAIDLDLHDRVLDADLCKQQLEALSQLLPDNTPFIEANEKLFHDLNIDRERDYEGDFFNCLSINQRISNIDFQGKYCKISMNVPKHLADERSTLNTERLEEITDYVERRKWFTFRKTFDCEAKPREAQWSVLKNTSVVTMGVCIPAPCTTSEALDLVLDLSHRPLTSRGHQVTDLSHSVLFCRLPGDKPYALLDYIAAMVLVGLVFITIASTVYDLHTLNESSDCGKKSNPIYRSFSVYSNTRGLLTFRSSNESVDCVDGIRALSMAWVLLLHSYYLVDESEYPLNHQRSSFQYNVVFPGFYAVDTFFLLSGVFLVYSTIGKFSRKSFLNNLTHFYTNRFVRLLPLVCFVLLMEVSVLNHAADGPRWTKVTRRVDSCRATWWVHLLFVQNLINFCVQPAGYEAACLDHLWYLAVDMQLYVISPLMLVWLFGNKRVAWSALSAFIVLAIGCSTALSFLLNFSFTGSLQIARRVDEIEYREKFYINTFARAAPYFIGSAFGYFLYGFKGEKRYYSISKKLSSSLWLVSAATICACLFVFRTSMQYDFTNQSAENVFNSVMRSVWCLPICWIIWACHCGYGGIINWLLSLKVGKVVSRVSYTMYVVHIPLVELFQAASSDTIILGVDDWLGIEKFVFNFAITFVFSFLLTIAVEMPAMNLYKSMQGNRNKLAEKRETVSKDNKIESLCSDLGGDYKPGSFKTVKTF